MKQAKHDFTKTMRNVNLKDVEHGETRRRKSQDTWILECKIEPSDAILLGQYQRSELAYYNRLVESMNSYVRTRPELFMAIVDRWEDLFGELAFANADVRLIQFMKPDAELPANLEPFRDLLLGRDSAGKRRFTERNAIFMEPAGTRVSIIPEVKKAMCLEVLRFYREQATRIEQRVPDSLKEEQTYKVSIEMLNSCDSLIKRHNQIPRSALTIEYNEKENISYVKTPYTTYLIPVPGENISEEKWNLMILHQQKNQIPRLDTPWVVELRSIKSQYMAKYVDVVNPYSKSAFKTEKAGRH